MDFTVHPLALVAGATSEGQDAAAVWLVVLPLALVAVAAGPRHNAVAVTLVVPEFAFVAIAVVVNVDSTAMFFPMPVLAIVAIAATPDELSPAMRLAVPVGWTAWDGRRGRGAGLELYPGERVSGFCRWATITSCCRLSSARQIREVLGEGGA